jgi:hypothetical protein
VNPYAILVAVLAIAAAGVQGYRMGIDHQKALQADLQQAVEQGAAAAADSAAKVIAGLKVKSTTITNEVQREIKTNTVYADCRLTPGGLQLANQALTTGAAPNAAGAGQLPGADSAP